MSNIILVAETGSDIPKDIAEQLGIFLVPCMLLWGMILLMMELFSRKICEYYNNTKKIPKTSGCSPEDFIRVFDKIPAYIQINKYYI